MGGGLSRLAGYLGPDAALLSLSWPFQLVCGDCCVVLLCFVIGRFQLRRKGLGRGGVVCPARPAPRLPLVSLWPRAFPSSLPPTKHEADGVMWRSADGLFLLSHAPL